MKLLLVFLFIFTINCQGNKVTNYHGNKSLEKKYDILKENFTNKNDLIKIMGYPSTVSDFDENKWFYIERLKTNQSLFKLGRQKIKKNNVLIVQLNDKGILKNKKLLNLDDMNDIKFLEITTGKDFSKNNALYEVFSSLREKINAPTRNIK
tara:strand:- start:689 stop:1141 length:453 start_codon:yes stop_codon:yes gene_type:complete